ncbi:MAG: N-acetylmuramoyl-L-alanine amidase [Actinobacteria bacterium]|nr:MAG: N-acetylmuramoyl-L-alanine amidase [Actinomycetota bacterium]
MRVIREGDRGRQVADVQRRLAALGHPASDKELSGVFGPETKLRVMAFQQERGLSVDGIVGDDTWRQLVEASWRLGDRVLYLAAPHLRGDDVRDLQDRLATLGLNSGRIDGIFGAQTETAVREFQRNYGLPPDGIIAAQSVRALTGLPRMASDLPIGVLREREALRRRTATGIAGLRVVVDPGHGGDDPGFVGPGGAREDVVCFAVATALEAALTASGTQVFLTRRPGDGPADAERATLANTLEADLFLALHSGGAEPSARGAAAFYFGHERFHSETGMRVAELLLEHVCTLGFIDGRAHAKTFPVLRETRMPAVMLEAGYITNPDEERLLVDPGFQQQLAAAIAEGLRRFAREPAGV